MRLKYVLIGLFVLVVAVLVAGYAVLSTLDINKYRDQIIAEAEKATGRTLRIDGDMDLKVSFTPAVVLNDVGLSNAEWASEPEMISVKRFELEVAILPLLSSELQIKRLIVGEPDIQLEMREDGTANWTLDVGDKTADSKPKPAKEGEQLKLSFDEAVIENANLVFKNGQTGETSQLSLDSLTATADSPTSPLTIDASGSYQAVAFGLAGTLSSLATLTDPDQQKVVDLAGSVGGADFTAKGSLLLSGGDPTADLALTFKADDLEGLAPLAGGSLPPLTGIDVTTQVNLKGQTLKLGDLNAKVANSDLAGNLTLVAGATPSVSGLVQSNTIDLRDFTPEGGEGEGAPAASAGGGDSPYVIPDTPLPLDFLKTALVDVKLAVGALILNDSMTLEQMQGQIGLKDGKLTLTPLKTLLSDGQLELNTTLDSARKAPALDFGFTADNVDYGKLLREQGVYDKMRGTIGADIALTGAGASPRAIASSLNGTIDIEGGEGQLDNRLLKVLTAGVDQLGQLFSKEESNKLNCILVRFDVKDGVATSTAMVIDSQVLTISGGGTVDLRSEKLDLYFETSTRSASLASLAVPFRVGGTMKNPKVFPDLAGTALKAAQAGGIILNPAAGLAAVLGTQAATGSDETACSAAVEQVQSESGPSFTEDPVKAIGDTLKSGAESGDEAIKGATDKLKKLFGN
ncbi:AsmA family protein [Limibacillus halophilus]